MMCRQLALLVLALALCLPPAPPAYAQQPDSPVQDAELPDADILLLYDTPLLEKHRQNVQALADSLTYMGYKTTYAGTQQARGQLGRFPRILYYHLQNEADNGTAAELADTGRPVLVVGGDAGPLARAMGLDLPFSQATGSASLTYELTGRFPETRMSLQQETYLAAPKDGYQNGTVHTGRQTGPYCVRSGRLTYLALYDAANAFLHAAFTQEFAQWVWPYRNAPPTYAQYIAFEQVYPFVDTDTLQTLVDDMVASGLPWALVVAPVYQNAHFPAMKRFCEILRYAQSKGGALVLDAPIVQREELLADEVRKYITTAYEAYTQYGVYPLALRAPADWMYDAQGLAILRGFRTVLLQESSGQTTWPGDTPHNAIYADGHQLIAPGVYTQNGGGSAVRAYSTAVYLDALLPREERLARLLQIQQSSVPLKSLWSLEHSVYTGPYHLSYADDVLLWQEEPVSLTYEPFVYEAEFDYNRDLLGRLQTDLANSTRHLLVAVLVVSAVFLALIVFARYQNRKRFFFHKGGRT